MFRKFLFYLLFVVVWNNAVWGQTDLRMTLQSYGEFVPSLVVQVALDYPTTTTTELYTDTVRHIEESFSQLLDEVGAYHLNIHLKSNGTIVDSLSYPVSVTEKETRIAVSLFFEPPTLQNALTIHGHLAVFRYRPPPHSIRFTPVGRPRVGDSPHGVLTITPIDWWLVEELPWIMGVCLSRAVGERAWTKPRCTSPEFKQIAPADSTDSTAVQFHVRMPTMTFSKAGRYRFSLSYMAHPDFPTRKQTITHRSVIWGLQTTDYYELSTIIPVQ